MTSKHSLSLKTFIIVALMFSPSVEARAQKVEEVKSPYERIANSYLKSFDIEEMDSSSNDEKKLDIEQENISEYDREKLTLGVLSFLHEQPNEIINESLWKDLDLFCGAGTNTGAHLLSKVDRTSTVFGRAYLAKMLASPTADVNALRKRQNVVKELLNNRSLYHSLNSDLADLKRVDDGLLSFWTGKDKNNEKFIDKAVYYNFGPLKRFNQSTKALELSTRFQQAGTLLACSLYPLVHFNINLLNNTFVKHLASLNKPPCLKDIETALMKRNPELFLNNPELLKEHPEFADEYDKQLETLMEKDEKMEHLINDRLLFSLKRAELGAVEPGTEKDGGENKKFSKLFKENPGLFSNFGKLITDLGSKHKKQWHHSPRDCHGGYKKELFSEFEEKAKEFVKDKPDLAKEFREFLYENTSLISDFDKASKFRSMLDTYDLRKGLDKEDYPELFKNYPALALDKFDFHERNFAVNDLLFRGFKKGKYGEKISSWGTVAYNYLKHSILDTPQSLKDTLSLKNERFIVNGLLGKSNIEGIDRKAYIPVAVMEVGLIAFSAFLMYKTIPPQKQAIEIANYLQARLTAVADYLRGMRSIGQSVFSNKVLRNKLLLNGEMLSLFDKRSRKSKELDKLIELLSTRTFNGEASFFSWTGRVLAAYKLMLESKDEFAEAFEAIGEVDAHMSIAKLHKEYSDQRATFSFPTYDDGSVPYISLKEFWNPFISADTVVKNNVELGGANPSNVILTGPNAGGKSTVLRGITINLLLAQTLGVAPCEEINLTPFSKINTYLNITDDIAAGNSLFKSEVLRAQKLLKIIKSLGHRELSFTIMDEIFSGTSPKEGEAASYTVSKSLGKHKKSMCLVATHFPKLTNLEEDTGGMFKNYKVSVVKNPNGTLTYPYKLEEGKTDQNIAFDILANEGVLDEFELSEAQSMLEDTKA